MRAAAGEVGNGLQDTVLQLVGAPVAQQCGRAVHVDAHIVDLGTLMLHDFPAECGALSAGELAMAFFLFDAAACVQNDMEPPAPPPIVVN